MFDTMIRRSCSVLLMWGWACMAHGTARGFLDFNLYPYLSDIDSDTSFSLNTAAKFDQRWSYYSVTDFSNGDQRKAIEEVSGYSTEQNLRYHLWGHSPFDATVQWAMHSGDRNDVWRFGVRWRLQDSNFWQSWFQRVQLSYTINAHILQLDHSEDSVWQLEHAFHWLPPGALGERIYLAGQIDHTFGETLPAHYPRHPIAAEIQLGYRFLRQFYFVYEYRLDQYRRADVNNSALGVEYKFLF